MFIIKTPSINTFRELRPCNTAQWLTHMYTRPHTNTHKWIICVLFHSIFTKYRKKRIIKKSGGNRDIKTRNIISNGDWWTSKKMSGIIVLLLSLRPPKWRQRTECSQQTDYHLFSKTETAPPQLNPQEEGPPKKTTNPKSLCLKHCTGHANQMEMSSFWIFQREGKRRLTFREK
jgi:hypothetical protein